MAALYRRACAVLRLNVRNVCSARSTVDLRVTPSSRALFDQELRIHVSGLSPRQQVHLQAKHTDDKGLGFEATSIYRADEMGRVDLGRHPSLGGSYTGVEPMGLFWSMLPEQPHKKLLKRDSCSPVTVDVEVLTEGGELLTTDTLHRHFMSEGVRRVPVTHGRLRGTIFIPPGDGPFPGIIDLYTLGGLACEPRAALLANKGFVVFALAFYGYQDMPQSIDRLDLEYFEEGITFLQRQPEVKQTGIGILSISKSGDLGLSVSSFLPNVSATVCINTSNANILFPLHYRDMIIPALTGNAKRVTMTDAGLLDIRDVLPDPEVERPDTVIPIERASCNFLFLVSGDDRNWNSALFAQQACSRLRKHGRNNYETVSYPKAGHFLEVPYMPHCPSGLHAAVGQAVAFGGEAKAHAHAQVDAWWRVQEFFKKHL